MPLEDGRLLIDANRYDKLLSVIFLKIRSPYERVKLIVINILFCGIGESVK